MKRKVNIYILFIVFAANVLVLVGISLYAKKMLKTDIESQRKALSSRVISEFENFELLLAVIEKYTKTKNQIKTISFSKRLVNKWGEPDKIPVDTLKRMAYQLEVDDIYLINREGTIINSSLEEEIGYNLMNEGESFSRFFESLFLSNEYYSYSLGIGEADNIIKLYSYYVPKEAEFAVETSINIKEYIKQEFPQGNLGETFFNLKKQLIKSEKHIVDFDLYNLNDATQVSIFNTNRKIPLNNYELKKLGHENTLSFETEYGEKFYKLFDMSPEIFGFPARIVLAAEFNFDYYYSEYKQMMILSLIILIVSLLFISVLSPKIVDAYLINKIEVIQHNLDAIKLTKYNNLKSFSGTDELSGIANNIVELRDSVVLREEQLEEAKTNAEAADKLKSAFLANMSHEIRTPLNAVVGFAQLLRDSNVKKGDMLKYIELINGNSEKLLQIISDIIDLSQIESGQLKIISKPLCLTEFMNEIYVMAQSKLKKSWLDDSKERDLTFEVSKEKLPRGECIITDQYRLKQIFYQLIDNAIKFTCLGKIVFGYYLEENELHFFVKDTGIGIASEDLNRIFERFVQVEEYMTREYGGTGLGLAITHGLIRLLNGRLSVDSQIGEGSTFEFIIPYRTS